MLRRVLEEVEWGLGTRVLRMVAAFWAGIPVEVTQEVDVVPRCRRAAIGTPFQSPHTTRRKMLPPAHSDHSPTKFGTELPLLNVSQCIRIYL